MTNENKNVIDFNGILKTYKINAECVDFNQINNYSYYDLKLKSNSKVRDVEKFSTEIALALKAANKPSIKIIPQDGIIRFELLSPRSDTLNLFDYFTNNDIPLGNLQCLLGESMDGKKVWMNLEDNPHMIIAGTTGSGKSSLLNNIIANLFNYHDVNLFLIDPKNIEFEPYSSLVPNIGYSYFDAIMLLNEVYSIMNIRYEMIRDGISKDKLPPVVVIIDEFADLIMQDKNDVFYNLLCKLAQKCRAARIHIILSTQRPSVNIVDGTIKANFPARIACRVSSSVDSRVILDENGAENLIGKGDALLKDNFRHLLRFQVAYTNPQEVVNYFHQANAASF